jgi:serine/threonine protein kinase
VDLGVEVATESAASQDYTTLPASAISGSGGSLEYVRIPQKLRTLSATTYARIPKSIDELENPSMDRTALDPALLETGVKIGNGAFGVVYAGSYNGRAVAIKQMKDEVADDTMAEFLAEATIMAAIPDHDHVVTFIGLLMHAGTGAPCIVIEFCEGSSLHEYLTDNVLSEQELWNLARGTAAGMQHLAKVGVVHRDLACRNILLGTNLSPQISDFGLSRLVEDESGGKTQSNTGPIRWLAPESLKHRRYSEKSDCWMWAVTVCEMVWRTDPYPGTELMEVGRKVARGELRPHEADIPTIPHELWVIVDTCFSFEADIRPPFSELHESLKAQPV